MRLLLAAVLIAAAGWSGYWWYGSGAENRAVRGWFAARDWAGFDTARTAGFPNRLDTRVQAPWLVAPDIDLTWSAPFVDLLRLSYRPGHYILALPETQFWRSTDLTVTLNSDTAQASVVFDGDPLQRASFVFDGVRLTSDAGWTARAQSLRIATDRTGPATHRVGLEAEALVVGNQPFALRITGDITLDAQNRPAGTLVAEIGDWPEALRLAARLGWLSADQFDGFLASAPLRPTGIPIVLKDGLVSLGGVTVGETPRLPVF